MGIVPGSQAVDEKDFLVHAASDMDRIKGPIFVHNYARRASQSTLFQRLLTTAAGC